MKTIRSRFGQNQRVYIISDAMGWYHGIRDGRGGKVMEITNIHRFSTFEYTVQDDNGDFWHIPEGDLSDTAPTLIDSPTK